MALKRVSDLQQKRKSIPFLVGGREDYEEDLM